ncbi:NEDD8-conjugating enzyme Ubc12 [Drosophila santomea]|uniref:NEDD8-conjugating enzyme Ubc12 n=1 Tax=Drosophila santomea TaxID=129105 RepID=UPI001952B055|nr:NEDD8-conjugating enzyme Ubc12 [Drosophila santomea]XP_039487822.1 NEDD8-conjugating enzyme Ubc12 [Drosophila santomea]
MPARRSERIAARGEATAAEGNASNMRLVVRLRRISDSSAQLEGPRGGRVPTRGRGRSRRTTHLAASHSTPIVPAGRVSERIATRVQQARAEATEGSTAQEASSSQSVYFPAQSGSSRGATRGSRGATGRQRRGRQPHSTVAAGPLNPGVAATVVRPVPLVHPNMPLPTSAAYVPIAASADFERLQHHSVVQSLFRFESGIPTQGDPLTITRLRREISEFASDQTEGCKVEMVGENLFHWVATIPGPSETVYEGGLFRVEIVFPRNYPFQPPYVAFLTKTYHCNIAFSGRLCLDILSSKWSPALSVSKVLISIMSLLADPNPDDPMEVGVADVFRRNRVLHDQHAREWTKRYAK